jgi:hypothetical protein
MDSSGAQGPGLIDLVLMSINGSTTAKPGMAMKSSLFRVAPLAIGQQRDAETDFSLRNALDTAVLDWINAQSSTAVSSRIIARQSLRIRVGCGMATLRFPVPRRRVRRSGVAGGFLSP